MRDEEKTKEQLINELTEARSRIADLEQAAQQSMPDDTYRMVFENLPLGIAITDSAGQLLIANSAFEMTLGKSLEVMKQTEPVRLGNQSLDDLLALPSGHEVWHEIELDGVPPRVLEVNVHPVETDSNPGGRVLVVREVTTERALRESEEKYRQLFSNELEAISIFDPESGQILDANQAYLKLYGYSHDELLAMTVADISAEPDETMQAVQDAMTTQNARILVRWHRKKDGTVFPVELYASAFEWKGQQVMCATMRDITERVDAEQRRIELALERERVRILSNFITQASHEFKTPLTAINTSAYLLGQTDDPETKGSHLRQISFQIEKTNELVNTLTAMAKLDSGEHLVHVELDINEVIRQVHQALQPALRDAKLGVVLDLAERPLFVQGDSFYLQQAIEHIWQNAIRYSSPGGTITVRSSCIASNIVIEISDTGIGIDENTRRRIFERFYRADVAGTARGFGLGLPIAKAIIEEHVGRIEVESEPGQGSTFTILLPRLLI